ncbi:MAG: DUF4388 domain-containing protein [Acidobacteriota bacterium]
MSEAGRHIFVADLAETPLPEMLATIHRHRVPGVLEADLGEFSKRVVIAHGDIIFASSTNRAESLGEMLLTSGRITKEQFRASTFALLDNPKKRHGQILVEMGLITEAELRAAVLEQVQRIVWSIFGAASGRVTFTLGEYAADEVYQLCIPTPRAILHGCKTVPNAKPMITRMGGKGTVFFRAPSPEHLQGFELEPGEEQLLDLVDGRRTFFELCEQGPFSAGLNARVLYAFHCLALVQREREAGSGIHVHVSSTAGGG